MSYPATLLNRDLKRDGLPCVDGDGGQGPVLTESIWFEVESLASEIPGHLDLVVTSAVRAHSHDHEHERSLGRLLGMPADVGSHGGVLADGEPHRGDCHEDESENWKECSREHTAR
jgi:hypothetical protein